MSRLIDADKAVERYSKELHKLIEAGCDPFTGSCEFIRDIMQAFDRQPTAYDVDKVVAELEDEMEECRLRGIEKGDYYSLGEGSGFAVAIEIVKRGGRNE